MRLATFWHQAVNFIIAIRIIDFTKNYNRNRTVMFICSPFSQTARHIIL